MPELELSFDDVTHSIVIEMGALCRVGGVAREIGGEQAALIIDENVVETHGKAALAALEDAGLAVTTMRLHADEKEKTLETVRHVYDALLAARIDRRTPLVAVGGGLVGDVAGFAAATFLRGIPFVNVPTTLLAMVDASIGGKTGVNLPLPAAPGSGAPRLGKNLVGAFYPPRRVLADPSTLATLTSRDFRCGLAETVKHAIIDDAPLFEELEQGAGAIDQRDGAALVALIHRSAAVKTRIVAEDLREAGVRALLNLGHTFAHAIEPVPELDLRHGEAVSVGLVAATECAAIMGEIDDEVVGRVRALLTMLGLPTALTSPWPIAPLLDAMGYDKKARGGRLHIVLPTRIGGARIADDVPAEAVRSAWFAVGGQDA